MIEDWLHYALRLFHLIAGIMWIGTSFYFVWMDSSFVPLAEPKEGTEGELYMVHGGFFYRVEKQRPLVLPKVLHWFKYEALLTWVSGIFLLGVMYWAGGGLAMMDAAHSRFTQWQAIGVSIGVLVGGWIVYDLIWKLVGKKAPKIALVLTLLMLVGTIHGLCAIFPGRAAFIHVGALLGTIMVVNVWHIILPNQRRMIAARIAGQEPDWERGAAAKHRSMHNSYMTIPVLIVMVSNHFSFVFDHPLNWVILCLLAVVGASIRHLMITIEKGQTAYWAFAPVVLGLGISVVMTRPQEIPPDHSPKVAFAEVNGIFQRRCLQCHSSTPTDDVFKNAPNGIMFDSPSTIQTLARRIRLQVVESRAMPFANKTKITDDEREIVRRWIDQGAHL